ncbi:hypothetical protein JOM56_013616 [Amanita muscaria]
MPPKASKAKLQVAAANARAKKAVMDDGVSVEVSLDDITGKYDEALEKIKALELELAEEKERAADVTRPNRRIVCSKGTWFYDDNSTEVHRNEWWTEKGANERPPHSLVYKEKLYYEKRQIDYFPQARLWAYIDQTTPQPLTDKDYEGVKPRTFQEFEQLAEKALPDEIVDEFIQSERNLHKKRQQEGGSKGLQPSRTPSRRISPSTSQNSPIQSSSGLTPLIIQREAAASGKTSLHKNA